VTDFAFTAKRSTRGTRIWSTLIGAGLHDIGVNHGCGPLVDLVRTGLDTYEARRQLLEERQDVAALQGGCLNLLSAWCSGNCTNRSARLSPISRSSARRGSADTAQPR
jgi:hypothetical protein